MGSADIQDDQRDQDPFVLGVDLDGVVADFVSALRPIAAEWLELPLESLTAEVSYGLREWNLDPAGGYEALHRFAVTQKNLFGAMKPFPGAPSVLRRLSAAGIRIRILTHRLYIRYFHQEAVRQTIEWLDRYGIPYWDLCFLRDKAAVGADLYIEDDPGNIVKLRSRNFPTIAFSNPTNRHLEDPRADTWAGIETHVLKLCRRRRLDS